MWPTLLQFLRYGVAGSVAAGTHLAVLMLLTELAALPSTLASALGFACAVPVNYALQNRFVFNPESRRHLLFFSRYVAVTLLTMALNVGLFWALTSGLGVFYVLSQIITIGVIVPLNFAINRSYTFQVAAPGPDAGSRRLPGGHRRHASDAQRARPGDQPRRPRRGPDGPGRLAHRQGSDDP